MKFRYIVIGALILLTLPGGLFIAQIMRYGGWVEYKYRHTLLDIEPDYRGNMVIFIMTGQSNMSGEGTLPAEVFTSPKIWVFGNDYQWKIASEPIDDGTNQVDMISFDPVPAYSLATNFARTYRANDKNLIIGLVPCMVGGASTYEWLRDLSPDSLYGSCLQRAKIAGLAGKIQGVLVFQGEYEAVYPMRGPGATPLNETYQEYFEQMIVDFRIDIEIVDLPFVHAQIAHAPEAPLLENWGKIQEAQANVDLLCTSMIITSDLPRQDGYHLNRDELDITGERFADAMWALIHEEGCAQ